MKHLRKIRELVGGFCLLVSMFGNAEFVATPGVRVWNLVSNVGEEVNVVNSKVDFDIGLDKKAFSKTCFLESAVEVLSFSDASSFDDISSRLEVINDIDNHVLSKVCIIDSKVDVVDSKIDLVTNQLLNIQVILQADVGAGGLLTLADAGVYVVGEPLSISTGAGIEIAADNVELDLNGFSIDGGLTTTAIVATGVTNLSIKNGSITNSTGIEIDSSKGVEISDISVIDGREFGIGVAGSSNVSIVNCNLIDVALGASTGSGILVDGSVGVAILDCICENNDEHGIDIGAEAGVIGRCICQGNILNGINVGSTGIALQLFKNFITGNGGDGIFIDSATTDISVTGNKILANVGAGLEVGLVAPAGLVATKNLCGNNGTNYSIGVGLTAILSLALPWGNAIG